MGNFDYELREEKNQKNMDAYFSLVDNSDDILYVHILNAQSNPDEFIKRYGKNMGIICKDKDTLPIYEDFFLDEEVKYCFIPDESSFRRRIRKNKVLLANRFNKLDRNYDYIAKDDEFFSDDHLYYLEDNYVGFSDYSIIGDEYSDTGFAPYAVAIHIVYFDNDYSFRIKHFVSDSNDDISDPARKFQEALSKLIAWNKEKHYETEAMKQFEDLFDKENYPGLGTVKKLSLMHHLELVGTYLDDKRGVI